MAFAHPQLVAQILHAVQRHVVVPDGRQRRRYQRRRLVYRLVRAGRRAQQAVGLPVIGAAAAQPHQQLRRAGTGRPVHPPGRPQRRGKVIGALPRQPHRQQVALPSRAQRQRRHPQQHIAAFAGGVPQQAVPAGKHPHPQPSAGQRAGGISLQFGGLRHRRVLVTKKYQFLHHHINKMLYHFL